MSDDKMRSAFETTVKVDAQGVKFGNSCWLSHEKITGYTADQLNTGNCRITGRAYIEWLQAALSQSEPVQSEINWQDMYQKEKRRSEMWIAKYEKDIGLLEKAYPALEHKPEVSRDWTEDFSYENGQYENKCSVCSSSFIGHKRRVICQTCLVIPEPEVSQPVGEIVSHGSVFFRTVVFFDGRAPEVGTKLFTSPSDYEALKQQLANLKSTQEIELVTANIENEALKAENAHLQFQLAEFANVEADCEKTTIEELDIKDKEIEALKADNSKLHAAIQRKVTDLAFVERWANHHAVKPCHTAQEALSCIQHYPSILEITKSYKDGVVPTTRNPYAEIEALRQRVAKLEFENSSIAEHQEIGRALQSECDSLRGHLAGWKSMETLKGEAK